MSRASSAAGGPPPLGQDVVVGARVEIAAGQGIVRWAGSNPPFAAGKWVGVELSTPTGKNDGSVKDERYFTCEPLHGMFIRPSQIKVLSMPSRPPSSASAASSNAPLPRPASSARMSSSSSTSAMPPPPVPTAASPLKPRPSVATRGPPPSSMPATARPTPPSLSRRPSSVTSTSSTGPGTATPGRLAASRTAPGAGPAGVRRAPQTLSAGGTASSSRVASPVKPTAPSSRVASPSKSSRPTAPVPLSSSTQRTAQAPAPVSPQAVRTQLTPLQRRPSSSSASPSKPSVPLPPATEGPTRRDQGMEELKIKLRVLEGKRVEEVEKLRALEGQVREVDDLKRGLGVMQNKLQTLQATLSQERLLSNQLTTTNASLESRLTDLTEQLEMVTLDKEFAEEKCETLELELEGEREKVGGLEDDVLALEEVNAEYERPPEEGAEKLSVAFVQLEKHNERLKEALIRLRDMSSEAERDHRSRITALEKDLADTSGLQAEYDALKESLDSAEILVEDLKIQLDDALGAEDMLELLTEKNLAMGEKLEEQRIAIEDLEALRELNDELEENHLETEKQLQEEIDHRESMYREEKFRNDDLEEALLDHQSTIVQFRDLVLQMQVEMDSLRQLHATQITESASLSTQSQSVININLRLQSSATKAQAKMIDLELLKVEAAQAWEHLSIVRNYLPQVYFELDADAARCVLFFDRLALKSALINEVVGQTNGIPEALHAAASETLVGTCEMRGQISHFTMLNRRFAASLRGSSTETYTKTAAIYHELSNVEKRIDHHIALLRTDEFKETECMGDIFRFLPQYEHLARTFFGETNFDLGVRQLDLVHGFDLDLDNFAAAVGFARQVIVAASEDSEIDVEEGGLTLEGAMYDPIQELLDLVKSAKVSSRKIVRRVEDVVKSSSALNVELLEPLQALTDHVSNSVNFAVQLAQRIGNYVGEIRTSKAPLQLSAILDFLKEITLEVTGEVDEPWETVADFVARLGEEASALLPVLMEQDQAHEVTFVAPWIARAQELAAAAQVNVEAEQQVAKLTSEVRDLSLEVRKRDQVAQESTVKIQLLERRVETSKQQAETITELESEAAQARRQERTLEDNLELVKAELEQAQQENTKLKQTQVDPEKRTPGLGSSPVVGDLAVEGSLETHYLVEQIEALRGALKCVREENTFLKSQDLLSTLPTLPSRSYFPSLPTLEPSSPTGSSSSSLPEEDAPSTPDGHRTRTDDWRKLETETILLFREVSNFSASPRVIDLTALSAPPTSLGDDFKPLRRFKRPDAVLEQRRRDGERLEGRVQDLRERTAQARAMQARARYGF